MTDFAKTMTEFDENFNAGDGTSSSSNKATTLHKMTTQMKFQLKLNLFAWIALKMELQNWRALTSRSTSKVIFLTSNLKIWVQSMANLHIEVVGGPARFPPGSCMKNKDSDKNRQDIRSPKPVAVPSQVGCPPSWLAPSLIFVMGTLC